MCELVLRVRNLPLGHCSVSRGDAHVLFRGDGGESVLFRVLIDYRGVPLQGYLSEIGTELEDPGGIMSAWSFSLVAVQVWSGGVGEGRETIISSS